MAQAAAKTMRPLWRALREPIKRDVRLGMSSGRAKAEAEAPPRARPQGPGTHARLRDFLGGGPLSAARNSQLEASADGGLPRTLRLMRLAGLDRACEIFVPSATSLSLDSRRRRNGSSALCRYAKGALMADTTGRGDKELEEFRAQHRREVELQAQDPQAFPEFTHFPVSALFTCVPVPSGPQPAPEYVYVPAPRKPRDMDALGYHGAISEWTLLWEAGVLRHGMKRLHPRLRFLKKYAGRNVILLPRDEVNNWPANPCTTCFRNRCWTVLAYPQSAAGASRRQPAT
jgi:hypothetical protein